MQLFEQAPTSDELVAFIDTQPDPVQVRHICRHFGIKPSKAGGSAYSKVRTLLRDLTMNGSIAMTQARPGAWHYYHSIPQTVAAVQKEQEGQVLRFKVGLQPHAPAISLEDLKAKARACNRRVADLMSQRGIINESLQQETARLDVLLSLIDPFDENFRALGEYRNA